MDERKRAVPQYDAVLKDLFQRDRTTVLDALTGGRRVAEFVTVEFADVKKQSADQLLKLEDGAALHIEFQSDNDPEMAHRMGIYGLLVSQRHACELEQVVVYLGEPALNMPGQLAVARITVAYRLIDIREFDAEILMQSGRPGDLALALLARGGKDRLREIVLAAKRLPEARQRRVFAQMAVLAGLRRLSDRLTMEFSTMGMEINIEENVILRDIRDKALARGRVEGGARTLRRILRDKFGPVPLWASRRLSSASPAQIQRWTGNFVKAKTLEAVIGKP